MKYQDYEDELFKDIDVVDALGDVRTSPVACVKELNRIGYRIYKIKNLKK